MKVIVISGKAGHGKDTAAGFLKDELEKYGGHVMVTHFADLLKYICKSYCGWNGEKDDAGRWLLQYIGTDVIRKQDPNFWVDFIASISKFFNKFWDYMIIPDCRFPNEVDRLKECGLDVQHIRVVRDGYEGVLTSRQKEHPSETALDDVAPDYILKNDGSLDNLQEQIHKYLDDMITPYLQITMDDILN